MEQIVELLRNAHALIEDEAHWWQGSMRRLRPDGSVAYCLLGAVKEAAGSHRAAQFKAIAFVLAAIADLEGGIDDSANNGILGGIVSSFNDNRTHREVLAVLDSAIAQAKKGKEPDLMGYMPVRARGGKS